jgi:hypothetical protein
MLEGIKSTVQPLIFEMRYKNQKIYEKEFPSSISGVEDMYGHFNLRPDNLGRSTQALPWNCPNPENEKAVVFVHGFRATFDGARGWNAEMFKRLHQSGSNARFYGVTWRGDDGFANGGLNYHGNVVHAFNTAPALATAVSGISGEVVMMAQSLGNMVVSSAMYDSPLRMGSVSKLLALNAALPAEAFDSSTVKIATNIEIMDNLMVHDEWRGYYSTLWASRFHILFPSSDWRNGLTWVDRFSTVVPKLYNFYSTGDEVFEIFNGMPGPLTGVDLLDLSTYGNHAWHKQEIFKGGGGTVGTDWAGWGFEKDWLGNKVYTQAQANGLSFAQMAAAP